MKRLQRDAVILSLIENLRAKGSWCNFLFQTIQCIFLE